MVCIKSVALMLAAAASASASSLRGRSLATTAQPTTMKPTLVPTAGKLLCSLCLLSLAPLPFNSFQPTNNDF
jgi:hypothetical protein